MEKLRTHSQPLPKSKDNVIALVKRVLSLSGVQEIRIRPNEFFVERSMEDETAPVLPKESTTTAVDVDFLLSKIAENDELHTSEFSPELHPFEVLERVTREVADGLGLVVCGMLAPEDTLDAYFDLEIQDPPTVMGIRVVYHGSDKYADKLVILGGPTIYINDATHGIIIDMGV